MDQWRSKFSESFSLDRYWSIECSSLRRSLDPALHSQDEQGLVDVSDIFYFFCSGEGGRGCPKRREGGGFFY